MNQDLGFYLRQDERGDWLYCEDGEERYATLPERVLWDALHAPQAQAAGRDERAALILKGIGKINGDGWKDVTKLGEVVYVWNSELPEPYAPGQFPRIGNEGWSASTTQYDFMPATVDEAKALLAELLDAERERTLQDVKEQRQQVEVARAALAQRQPLTRDQVLDVLAPFQGVAEEEMDYDALVDRAMRACAEKWGVKLGATTGEQHG